MTLAGTPSSPWRARRSVLGLAGAHVVAPYAWAQSRTPMRVATAQAATVVCIGGALTEIVYALQAQDSLVGVDSTSTYPLAARKLPNVGYARSLSAEGILALAPRLILASEQAGPPAVIRQLQAAGLKLEVIPTTFTFAGLLQRVVRVGVLLGRQSAAAALVRSLQDQWRQSQQHLAATARPGRVPPRVLFILSHIPGQARVAGRATAADAILRYAGAQNVVQQFTGYKTLSAEAMIAAQPEVIVMTTQEPTSAQTAKIQALPGVALTPAGRNGRILAYEPMLMLGFGPRLPQIVEALHRSLMASKEAVACRCLQRLRPQRGMASVVHPEFAASRAQA